MSRRLWLLNPAWWRHVLSHRGCEYKAWWASDGWYCGGCQRSWDTSGRLDDNGGSDD